MIQKPREIERSIFISHHWKRVRIARRLVLRLYNNLASVSGHIRNFKLRELDVYDRTRTLLQDFEPAFLECLPIPEAQRLTD